MKTARLRSAVCAALVVLSLGACSSGSGGGSAATSAPAGATAGSSPAGSPAAGALRITIKNFAFSPDTATVKAGETVTVVNDDSAAHTLTASDKSFDTGTIEPGKSATFTAPAKAGSFPYICTIHPFMHGTLNVG